MGRVESRLHPCQRRFAALHLSGAVGNQGGGQPPLVEAVRNRCSDRLGKFGPDALDLPLHRVCMGAIGRIAPQVGIGLEARDPRELAELIGLAAHFPRPVASGRTRATVTGPRPRTRGERRAAGLARGVRPVPAADRSGAPVRPARSGPRPQAPLVPRGFPFRPATKPGQGFPVDIMGRLPRGRRHSRAAPWPAWPRQSGWRRRRGRTRCTGSRRRS